jgi:hypothetical protein
MPLLGQALDGISDGIQPGGRARDLALDAYALDFQLLALGR